MYAFVHFSHVNGFPHWLPFQVGALRSPEKLNAFSKAEQAPECVPFPPVSSLFWIRSLEIQGICWFFFFFLLNTFPLSTASVQFCGGKLFSFRVRLYFVAKDVLWAVPLCCFIPKMWRNVEFLGHAFVVDFFFFF